MKKTTIRDVANQAKVSISTVSKFLNETHYVSEEKKNRIREAIKKLDYEPNHIARSLVKQKTNYLGLLVPTISNQFYPNLVEAIEKEASNKGYYLILANTSASSEKEIELARSLGNSRVEGLIFSSVTNSDSDSLNQLLKEGYNFVMTSRHVEEVKADFAIIDGFDGAEKATKHLINLGHKNIGYIGGSQIIYQYKVRYKGFQYTLAVNGIQENLSCVSFNTPTVQGGYDSLLNIIRSGEITALFVANDTMAIGVLEACRELNIKVPEQLAIVSFDNIDFFRLGEAPLATLDSRIPELAKISVQMLVDQLEGKPRFPPRQEILKPNLIIRKSCGALLQRNKRNNLKNINRGENND